jgi:hypothetical protein
MDPGCAHGLGVIPDDTADRCTFHPVKIVAGQKSMTVLTIELEANEHLNYQARLKRRRRNWIPAC